jgi:phosphoserine phosphatase
MKKIAVFDLDGTLISGDSFRLLIQRNLVTTPTLLVWLAGRASRFIGRKEFAEAAHRALLPSLASKDYRESFLSSLHHLIRQDVLDRARRFNDEGIVTVLLSASPHDYVHPFGASLGFQHSFGSTWESDLYSHLYGETKKTFLERHLPKDAWLWHYSAADSESDKALLAHFEIAEMIRNA